jgi:hypothetical protein
LHFRVSVSERHEIVTARNDTRVRVCGPGR